MGSHPLLPPGKLSPSLSSAPDGLTSPLFPAASVSLFLFRSFPFLLLLFPARLPKSSLSLFHARARDGARTMLLFPIGFYTIHAIRFPRVSLWSESFRARSESLSIPGFWEREISRIFEN